MINQHFAKLFISLGIILIVIGLFFLIGHQIIEKLPFKIGRLPGDIIIKKENFTFYFPVTSCLLISIVLTILFILINRR